MGGKCSRLLFSVFILHLAAGFFYSKERDVGPLFLFYSESSKELVTGGLGPAALALILRSP